MKSALRGLDVGIFQDTKMMDGIYTWRLAGYKVVGMSALSRHCGGVRLFYWDSSAFAVEAIQQFGVNVITGQMVTGERQWHIVVYYLAPGDDTTIQDVEAAMADRPRGMELIVVIDFNVDLEKTGCRG